MKPISLQLYTVRELAADDFVGVLRKVAGLGYAGVEFGGLRDHDPAEIKKLLDDLGLAVSSLHGPPATEDSLGRIVDYAELFGVGVLVGGYRRDAWETLDGIREAADACQKSAELLGPHGIRQAYHNHWWEMADFDGTLGLEHFLAAAPDVDTQLDVYWASNFGAVDVPAFLGKWASRASTLHVKDGPLVEGEPHTAVGAGKMDIPAVIAAADESVLRWLIVELDHCATDMMQAVADSIDYLTSNGLGRGRT